MAAAAQIRAATRTKAVANFIANFAFFIQELVKVVKVTDEFLLKSNAFIAKTNPPKIPENIKSTAVTCFRLAISIEMHFPPIKVTIDEAVNFVDF